MKRDTLAAANEQKCERYGWWIKGTTKSRGAETELLGTPAKQFVAKNATNQNVTSIICTLVTQIDGCDGSDHGP